MEQPRRKDKTKLVFKRKRLKKRKDRKTKKLCYKVKQVTDTIHNGESSRYISNQRLTNRIGLFRHGKISKPVSRHKEYNPETNARLNQDLHTLINIGNCKTTSRPPIAELESNSKTIENSFQIEDPTLPMSTSYIEANDNFNPVPQTNNSKVHSKAHNTTGKVDKNWNVKYMEYPSDFIPQAHSSMCVGSSPAEIAYNKSPKLSTIQFCELFLKDLKTVCAKFSSVKLKPTDPEVKNRASSIGQSLYLAAKFNESPDLIYHSMIDKSEVEEFHLNLGSEFFPPCPTSTLPFTSPETPKNYFPSPRTFNFTSSSCTQDSIEEEYNLKSTIYNVYEDEEKYNVLYKEHELIPPSSEAPKYVHGLVNPPLFESSLDISDPIPHLCRRKMY